MRGIAFSLLAFFLAVPSSEMTAIGCSASTTMFGCVPPCLRFRVRRRRSTFAKSCGGRGFTNAGVGRSGRFVRAWRGDAGGSRVRCPYQDYSWMAYLAHAGFDVFSMDMTGYGRSDAASRR